MFVVVPKDITLHLETDQGGRVYDACAVSPGTPLAAPFNREQTATWARDFVRKLVLVDPAFGRSMDLVYMAMEIRAAIEGKKAGDVVELPKGHVEKCVEVIKSPNGGHVPVVAVHWVSFFEAFTKASNEDPRPREASASAQAS